MRFFKPTSNTLFLLGRSTACLIFAAGVIALAPTKAAAASFTVDLCDAAPAECTEDFLTEASLTFDEIAGGDLNDYNMTMTLIGAAGATTNIDQVSFVIGGVDNVTGATGYETKPTVTGPSGTWTVFYDNVSNAASCAADTNNSQEVCANSATVESTLGTNTWTWFVNISDSLGQIGVGTSLNLRAHFLTAAGGPGGNFSPDFGIVSTTTNTVTTVTSTILTSTENVPEPALLTLLGAGLAGVSLRLRRRKA